MRILPVLFIALVTLFIGVNPVLAVSPSVDIADTFPVPDKSAVDGDILVTSDAGLQRAASAYNPRLFGILQNDPITVYRTVNSTNQPIIRNGVASVNVTDLNGTIKKGDYITSSEISGKGQKAIQSGYVIGTALEDFPNSTSKVSFQNRSLNSAQISVAMRIEYADINSAQSLSRLLDYFNAALFKNLQNPDQFAQLVRYFLAATIAIVALFLAYFSFTSSILKSLEALGRNPLARGPIILSLGINGLIILTVVGIGLFIAVILVRI